MTVREWYNFNNQLERFHLGYTYLNSAATKMDLDDINELFGECEIKSVNYDAYADGIIIKIYNGS